VSVIVSSGSIPSGINERRCIMSKILLAAFLGIFFCVANIAAYAVKSSDPQHGAKLSRLATIKDDLLPAQEEIRRNLQTHLQAARDPDVIFVPLDGEVVPTKRLTWRSRVLDVVVAGKLTSEQAAKKMEETERFSKKYKRELSNEMNRVNQTIQALNAEMGRIRADLNKPSTTTPTPTASTPPSRGASGPMRMSELEYDTDRPGQDYTYYEVGTSAEACRSRCMSESKCRAFTWVRSGVQGNVPRCWLKHGVPSKAKTDCCVSGVKIAEQDNVPPNPSTPAPRGKIQVISAVYGANCRRPSDVSGSLRQACDTKQRCDYLVDHTKLGDPAVGCRKDYVYRWRCVGSEKYAPVSEQIVMPEASGKYASLWCS
jgi:hypothetical protein